jgi:hypothetical protein
MATRIWRGDAPAVAQVSSATITAYDASTTYAITINGKTVSVLGTGGTATTTAVALLAALQASTIPEFMEVTWTNPTGAQITGTAATAGVPFTATSSVSGGTGTFGAFSTTTTSQGPNDYSTAGNWSQGSVPVAGDDVYFQNSAVDCLYGLSQAGATLNSLNILASYTGHIGLPNWNSSGYYEYRPKFLAVDATTVNIGQGAGGGSGRVKLDQGGVQTTWNVYATGSPAEDGVPALLLKGTNAGNVLNAYKGSVGVAFEPGDTSTIATVREGYTTSPSSDVDLKLGTGCTLTTVTKSGGLLEINSNVTTLTQTAGDTTIKGSATVTTLNNRGGNVYYNTSGTCTTALCEGGAKIDLSGDLRAKTFTNAVELYKGATWYDPYGVATLSAGFTTVECLLEDVAVNCGPNRTYTPA